MTQSLLNLEEKVSSLNDLIEERGDGLVQQVYSSPHYLVLQTRFRGETKYVYLGRGGRDQGMDFSHLKIPSEIRIQDKFLQYARKNWRGMRIKKVSLPQKDRLLEIAGTIGRNKQFIWFFWKGRDLYFADMVIEESGIRLFQSWLGKSKHTHDVASNLKAEVIFGELGLRELEEGVNRKGSLNIEDYLNKSKLSEKINSPPGKHPKGLLKKNSKMKEDLNKFQILKYLEAQTDKDLENVNSIGEGRYSISFKGLEGHYKKREYLYDKVKAWKNSQKNLERRIKLLEESLSVAPSNSKPKFKNLIANQKTISPVWGNKSQPKVSFNKTKFVSFVYNDFHCYVGRRATESDAIRKEIAKKEDLWIHLDGYKSGHLFIKGSRDPSIDELSVLASALVDYSGLSIADIPILFTQVKNLKGVKGIPGMVNYKKEKQLLVLYDSEWRQKITSIEDNG